MIKGDKKHQSDVFSIWKMIRSPGLLITIVALAGAQLIWCRGRETRNRQGRRPLWWQREAPTIAEAPTPEEINYSPLLPPHPTNSYIPLGLCNNFMLLSILGIPIYISLSTFKASCLPKSPFSGLETFMANICHLGFIEVPCSVCLKLLIIAAYSSQNWGRYIPFTCTCAL